nr:PREDICTED: uncharacterized protein LOC109031353 [Bemisia tabaci]
MVVKTRSNPKNRALRCIDTSNNWQRIKLSPSPIKRKESAMSKESSLPERPETATLDKPSVLDPNLSKKIDMTILSRENLKYVNNLVVKPIPKKASLEEQTQALNSLTAGLNTISGPNSLIVTSAESRLKGVAKTPSSFNPVSLDPQKKAEPKSKRDSTHISPSQPTRGKTVLLESKPRITSKKAPDETPSKLSKLYKVINKNYRIRTSFRRAKDKSSTSRSSSRCDVTSQDESRLAKPEAEKPHGGKLKKAGKKSGGKEKKSEVGAQRRPFASKFKGRSKSLKRSEEAVKGSKKEKFLGEALGEGEKKVPGSSSSSQIPVRRTMKEGTASGPSSLTAEDLRPVTRDLENGYSLTEWIPVPPSSGRRPRLITCRFCSREFGTASYPVHEPRCMRLWLGEQNKDNKTEDDSSIGQSDQGSVSSQTTKDSRGNNAEKKGRGKCGSSKPGTAKKSPDSGSVSGVEETVSLLSVAGGEGDTPTPSTPLGRRPPTVPCQICNREFGSKSIAIHEPQCRGKIQRESQRQPPLKKPTSATTTTASPDKENKMQQDAVSDDWFWESHREQLIPCKKCGRTFNPDRVVVHERSCKGRLPKKKGPQRTGTGPKRS